MPERGVQDRHACRRSRSALTDHPGHAVMPYQEFFRKRQKARYGENGGGASGAAGNASVGPNEAETAPLSKLKRLTHFEEAVV